MPVNAAFTYGHIYYNFTRSLTYVSSVEKIGIKKGIQQGIQTGRREGMLDAIELGLSIKFGINGLRLLPTVRAIENMDRLEMIKEAIKATDKLKEIGLYWGAEIERRKQSVEQPKNWLSGNSRGYYSGLISKSYRVFPHFVLNEF